MKVILSHRMVKTVGGEGMQVCITDWIKKFKIKFTDCSCQIDLVFQVYSLDIAYHRWTEISNYRVFWMKSWNFRFFEKKTVKRLKVLKNLSKNTIVNWHGVRKIWIKWLICRNRPKSARPKLAEVDQFWRFRFHSRFTSIWVRSTWPSLAYHCWVDTLT